MALKSEAAKLKKRIAYRRWCLKTKYGITPEDFDEMLEVQGGVCAICFDPSVPGRNYNQFVVDHDHRTGEVRGLLCGSCNLALGGFKDSKEMLQRALEYLELHT